jgi:hypothetical protein
VTVVDWLAFGVLVVSFVASAIILALRALDTWRAFRSLRRTVFKGLGDLERRISGIEARLAKLGDNAAKLDDAKTRLTRSLATASVLAEAAGEARESLGWLRTAVPRK